MFSKESINACLCDLFFDNCDHGLNKGIMVNYKDEIIKEVNRLDTEEKEENKLDLLDLCIKATKNITSEITGR